MRVLQIINSLAIGGAERLVVDTIPLNDPSIKTDVLLIKQTDSPFENELKEKNVDIFYLKRNAYNPLLIYDIMKYMRKYDLIHAHLFPTLYWVGIAKLLSFRNKIKIVFTEHSTTNRRRSHFLLKWTDKFIYNIYDRLIAISPKVKEALSCYLKNDNIITINNGIDIQKFNKVNIHDIKAELGLDQVSLLTQVANFKKSKDQVTSIKSVKLIPEDYHLILVGDGELRLECEVLAKKLGVSHRVHFLGKRSDISDILLLSDIVIVSSNWEGFGLAAVEGMAAQKPVIASNVDGLNDVVDGAGVLFERGNYEELSLIIRKLCEDKEYYTEIAEKCYRRAHDYDINKMKKELIKAYSVCFL
jgi:glycosyltransferase involved in cell wall biosynthesis